MKIERTNNGAVLRLENQDFENHDFEGDTYVFRFNDFLDKNDWDELREMLYSIAEHFAYRSKHDKYKLSINVEHGSDYECKEKKDCGICH